MGFRSVSTLALAGVEKRHPFAVKRGLLAMFALTLALGTSAAVQAETLRWSAAGSAVSFDPNASNQSFTSTMLAMVYDGLVARDGNLQLVPGLATSWEIVEPTRWRFALRADVTFHGGEPFTADDVVATIQRTIDPGSRNRGNLSNVVAAEKVDDLTVDLVLKGPYPLLLNDLAGISMMSKAWLEANNAVQPGNMDTGVVTYAATHANGTGPFKLESYEPDAKTVFVANENWWNAGDSNVDRVEYTPIRSDATRVAALLSGEVDLISVLPLQDIARVSETPGVKVVENPSLRTIYLLFNWQPESRSTAGQENPLLDVRVRQALWHAIDLEAIHSRIMRGKSRVTGASVAPQVPGYSPDLDVPLAYDPELAKSLLAEAGYPDGFTLKFGCPNDNYVAGEQICLAIAGMWSRIGVQADLASESMATITPRVQQGEFDVWLNGSANLPAIDGFIMVSGSLATRGEVYGSSNHTGMSFPAIDDIVSQVATELDETRRRALLTEALQIAHDEAMLIPIHQQPIAWAMKSNVEIPQLADEAVRPWLARIE